MPQRRELLVDLFSLGQFEWTYFTKNPTRLSNERVEFELSSCPPERRAFERSLDMLLNLANHFQPRQS